MTTTLPSSSPSPSLVAVILATGEASCLFNTGCGLVAPAVSSYTDAAVYSAGDYVGECSLAADADGRFGFSWASSLDEWADSELSAWLESCPDPYRAKLDVVDAVERALRSEVSS